MWLRIVACIGLFMTGAAFEAAIRGEGLFSGAVAPWLSAIIALVGAFGWAIVALDV